MAVISRQGFNQPVASPADDAYEEPFADIADQLESMSAEQTRRTVGFLEWAKRIPTARGFPLDFEQFPFQPEMYRVFGDPNVKDADGMKSTQVGMSELLSRISLYFPDLRPLTSLYVFPALKQMYDFSDTRINRLRENSDYLQTRTLRGPGWTWNKGLKRIGMGYCYFRGSESKNDLIAVDADVLALDEYDSLHPPNIPEAERRVSGSQLALIRRVGVPSDPEYGIAKRYAQSDGRVWMVKCGCKAKWQPIDFFKNVTWEEDSSGFIENPRVVCHRCKKPLDVLKGEWVVEHPDRDRPGFHVHRLMVPGERNLRTVIEASKAREPHLVKTFWNNDLGLPFTDKTGGLDRAAIAAALSAAVDYFRGPIQMVQGYTGPNLVTMGVDVASTRALNFRISEHLEPFNQPTHRKRALAIGEANSFNEIAQLMARFNINVAVIDHLPEGRLAYGMAEQFPGRVYVAHYSAQQLEPIVVDTDKRRVSVQRVPALDATIEVMRQLRNLLPEDIPAQYVEHMVTPRRIVEKDEYDRVTVRYEAKGPDDYFQSEVYDLLATEVLKVRLEFDDLTREEVWQLDERLEFERSNVNRYDDDTYHAGPGGDDFEYRGGPGS